jgi:hypothetical protein
MVVVVVSKVVDMMGCVEKNHSYYYYLGGMAKSSFVLCKAFVQ